ncbi:B12-binding domain-containing radical SAM protein [Spirochaetota bacterium]
MKVVFAFPPLEGEGTPLIGQNRQFQWFHNPTVLYPVVPATAATYLKESGHAVEWADGIVERMSYDEYIKKLEGIIPDLIVIETKTPVVKQHWRIINDIKKRMNTRVVIVGDHVTAMPKETMENCRIDFIIQGGYYDAALPDLVSAIEGKGSYPPNVWYRENSEIKTTGYKEPDLDLDSLPMIDRDLTNWSVYGEHLYKMARPFPYIMSGRDCFWGKCTFCSWTTLYKKFRSRSPENVLDEIGMLIDKYKVKAVFDDSGTFPPGAFLKEFCRGMIERGYNKKIRLTCNMRFGVLDFDTMKLMRKANFRLMKFGLESVNQSTLDRINKNLEVEQIVEDCKKMKKADIEVHITIMIGYPWETREDAEKTLKMAKYLMSRGLASTLQVTTLIAYPGTPLYKEAVENDWLRVGKDEYERFDMTEPIFKLPDMEPAEVMQICENIYKLFLSPLYLFHLLLKTRSLAEVKYLFNGIRPLFGHILDFKRRPETRE